MDVKICVGSSCHLKGSERIAELFQAALDEYSLTNKVALTGCFCTGKCNRVGVTVTIDGAAYTDVKPENFSMFFKDKVLAKIQTEKG